MSNAFLRPDGIMTVEFGASVDFSLNDILGVRLEGVAFADTSLKVDGTGTKRLPKITIFRLEETQDLRN